MDSPSSSSSLEPPAQDDSIFPALDPTFHDPLTLILHRLLAAPYTDQSQSLLQYLYDPSGTASLFGASPSLAAAALAVAPPNSGSRESQASIYLTHAALRQLLWVMQNRYRGTVSVPLVLDAGRVRPLDAAALAEHCQQGATRRIRSVIVRADDKMSLSLSSLSGDHMDQRSWMDKVVGPFAPALQELELRAAPPPPPAGPARSLDFSPLALSPLRSLRISFSGNLQDFNPLESIKVLSSTLQSLNFFASDLQWAALLPIASLPCLTSLHLASLTSSVNDDEERRLAAQIADQIALLPELKSLSFIACTPALHSLALHSAAARAARATSRQEQEGMEVEFEGDDSAASLCLGPAQTLERLCIEGATFGAEDSRHLSCFARLSLLHVGGSTFPIRDPIALSDIAQRASLSDLDLWLSDVSARSLSLLAPLSASVRHLALRHINPDSKDLSLASLFPPLPLSSPDDQAAAWKPWLQLTSLALRLGQHPEDALEPLSALAPTLRCLSISASAFRPESLCHITPLTRLRTLRIQSNERCDVFNVLDREEEWAGLASLRASLRELYLDLRQPIEASEAVLRREFGPRTRVVVRVVVHPFFVE